MRSKLKVFRDRSAVRSLPKNLVDVMSKRNIIYDDDKTVHFCGVVLYSDGVALFLPRNTDLRSLNSSGRAGSQLVNALGRYFREKKTAVHTSEFNEGRFSGDQLELMISLLEDYAWNGLYTRRVTERRMNSGKADWSRTIRSGTGLLTDNGIVYLDISGRHFSYHSDFETARIHAAVIRQIDSVLGWVVSDLGSVLDGALERLPEPAGDRAYQLSCLDRDLLSAYSDREIFIIESLQRYLRNLPSNEPAIRAVGVRNFHGVWEHMLDRCLKWTVNVNDRLPSPAYKIDGKYTLVGKKAQRTDTVVKSPDSDIYSVVDAKYYGTSSLDNLPGWPDLVKQFFYARALKNLFSSAVILNAFVFPGREGIAESAHISERSNREDAGAHLLDEEYPPVLCLYQEPLELVACYATRGKLDVLSFRLIDKQI